ncbi:MAG: hypothetical protein US69_C0008G0044 [candidate division TM6 bacterium GW2011_GWF2_38_10]|nr:MAG: hypothetical protein US69_C0008G0044 [candidate division TM6 bacterium GW2011_GWF2_38_10]
MLHEASSVSKAIEKAWTDAGKPSEFTIKVLEPGEKNFLGMSKRPSIVSISYDPKRQTAPAQDTQKKDAPKLQPQKPKQEQPAKSRTPERKEPVRQQRPAQPLQAQTETKKTPQAQPIKPMQAPQPKRQPQEPQHQGLAQQEPQSAESLAWQNEWVEFVGTELKALLATLQKPVSFSTKIDKKSLLITFDQKLHEESQDERAMFVSLSYLLMQFLKRTHKKKFRGFQLTLNSKR